MSEALPPIPELPAGLLKAVGEVGVFGAEGAVVMPAAEADTRSGPWTDN